MNIIEFLGYLWIMMTLVYIFRSPKRRRGYTRVAKGDPGPSPVTPSPGINPTCPMCGTWLRDLGDNFGCTKCGWKTKDIRKKGPKLPYGVKA